ncbi:Cobalamin synthase [Roseovarius albus]|uniref:Adenosylcobinamide-GDP ribazoletransferase n=1 Tax=Roseovarius albus TaxID=1247867 RepID=A0A1X6YJD5_9RHOB|nr:adenosylcobinamide-GDP ribazoletransferase [Roseovarius albus]SLN23421.1 Cobalamin synthase [Roseovarius albus]
MTKNDALFAQSDLPLAFNLLTRLPFSAVDSNRIAQSAWAYPVVGLAVGAASACTALFTLWLGLPAPLAALICLTIQIVTTGALHEDGLADSADGLWGGWDKTRRLEIMKDSRIGAYGVLALILSLAARWAAICLLLSQNPVVAALFIATSACLSRAAMVAVMAVLPNARASGLSHSVGQSSIQTAGAAFAIAVTLAILMSGMSVFGAVFWAILGAVAVGLVARNKIGGQTGDILGATQQISEIAILFSLVA